MVDRLFTMRYHAGVEQYTTIVCKSLDVSTDVQARLWRCWRRLELWMSRVTSAPRRKHRVNQPALDIRDDVFSDSAIRGLIDDWIVPMMVDRAIKSRIGKGGNA